MSNWTRIARDVNGNSRFVTSWTGYGFEDYADAIKAANRIGGRKYHTKGFGGGLVFQAYESQLEELGQQLRMAAKSTSNPIKPSSAKRRRPKFRVVKKPAVVGRVIKKGSIGIRSYVIRYDAEWQDNIVQFFVNGVHQAKADGHFYEDREDAIQTAEHWIAQAAISPSDVKHKSASDETKEFVDDYLGTRKNPVKVRPLKNNEYWIIFNDGKGDGFRYGLDRVTPIGWITRTVSKEPRGYSFKLPLETGKPPVYSKWLRDHQKGGKLLIGSLNELKTVVRGLIT